MGHIEDQKSHHQSLCFPKKVGFFQQSYWKVQVNVFLMIFTNIQNTAIIKYVFQAQKKPNPNDCDTFSHMIQHETSDQCQCGSFFWVKALSTAMMPWRLEHPYCLHLQGKVVNQWPIQILQNWGEGVWVDDLTKGHVNFRWVRWMYQVKKYTLLVL
jgi:hypothetical protein